MLIQGNPETALDAMTPHRSRRHPIARPDRQNRPQKSIHTIRLAQPTSRVHVHHPLVDPAVGGDTSPTGPPESSSLIPRARHRTSDVVFHVQHLVR
jgi:hypothetical protein